jgi:hypothetical protein
MIGLDPCGETDPEQFHPGRYNRCKRCRNEDTRKRVKEKKEMEKDELLDKKVEEVRDGRKIQSLVENIILHRNLMQEGMTIPGWISHFDKTISFYRKVDGEYKTEVLSKILSLERENEYIKKENQQLTKEISSIKNFLEEKFEKYFETF